MIITVTPNPSVDRAFDMGRLERGEVNRAASVHLDAGGKGINVSRVLLSGGAATTAIVPLGGPDGRLMIDLLELGGVSLVPVPISGDTRSNITVQEADGTTTKINAPGPILGRDERDAVLGAVWNIAGPDDIVVGAGSLPRGADEHWYVELAAITHEVGARFVVDTSGEPLVQVATKGQPMLIKPNEEELGELVGRTLATVGDVIEAAREVIAQGTQSLLVSLGAHGAIFVNETEVVWAGGPPLIPASTVGAGDSTLAGFLLGNGSNADKLRSAVAWGRAAVTLPGTAAPTLDLIDLDVIRVEKSPSPTTRIKELS